MAMELEIPLYELAEEVEEGAEKMATPGHSIISGNIFSELRQYLKGKQLGRAFESINEYRYLPKRKSEQGKEQQPYRKPDVSFVSQARLPKRLRPYFEIAPDLAVEVASPTDRDRDFDIELKVKEYQRFQVKLVWIVHPISRTIDVYRLATELLPEPIGIQGELNGEDVIPGFTLKVSDIFDYEADPDPDLP